MLLPAHPIDIPEAAILAEDPRSPRTRLHAWALRKQLHCQQIHDLLLLLDPTHLRRLGLCKKCRAWPQSPQPCNFRHHFYKQAAHVLGWVDQQVFEQEFVDIIRSTWPDCQNGTTEISQEGKTCKQISSILDS